MTADLVEHWTNQIFRLGEGKEYPIFRVYATQDDTAFYRDGMSFKWKAVAQFRHGHDVRVLDENGFGDTAAQALRVLYQRLANIYADNAFNMVPA